MKTKINSIIAITVLAFIALACNASFSSANISSLNFGKNETATPPTTTFNVGDRVNVLAVVSNSISKCKVRFKLYFDNVDGKKKGEEGGTLDVDLPGSGTATFSFNAVLPGDYKVDATLLDDSGKELGKKSGTISVKGSAPTTTTETKKDDAKKDDDSSSHSEDNTKEH